MNEKIQKLNKNPKGICKCAHLCNIGGAGGGLGGNRKAGGEKMYDSVGRKGGYHIVKRLVM